MALELFSHPFSSYCMKATIALYENDTPFELKLLDSAAPENFPVFASLWPMKKFPLLRDNGMSVMESSIIIEHLQIYYPGPVRLIPQDEDQALEARFMDRFFDNYVHTPQGRIVVNAIRKPEDRDPKGVEEARGMLETAYAWLDDLMADRQWAIGDQFTLADCSAGPALFYADWTHRIGERFKHVRAYRARLNSRPSFARCIEEARPYRGYFPLGAPDQD